MEPQSARRGVARSQRSHQAILEAATVLAEAGGPNAVTIEAVARRAGVGKQTIYRWWAGRGPLLMEVYETLVPAEAVADAQTDLRAMLVWLFKRYRSGPAGEILAALLADMRSDRALADEFRRRFLVEREAVTATLIRRTLTADPTRAALAARVVVAMVWYRLLVEPDRLDDALADDIVRIIEGVTA